jgi:lipid A 3-O-deacylase
MRSLHRYAVTTLRLVTLCLCLASVSACATTASQGDAITVSLENDVFTGSDNNYTNGFGISWVTREVGLYEDGDFRRDMVDFCSFLPAVGDEGTRNYVAWTLGHEMHTPHDTSDPNPPLDDQPYAGVLFLDNTVFTRTDHWGHAWNLRLGVVGPVSGAEHLQKGIHELIGSDEPQGWDSQLPNEPIVNVSYTTGFLLYDHRFRHGAVLRAIPILGGSVGNYSTGVNTGIYGEYGWNLADAMGFTSLHQGLNTASTIGGGPQDEFSFSVHAGVFGFGVAHYLPLDGTIFRESRSVDTNPFIGMASVGMSMRYKSLVLSLGQSYFTETFESQRQNPEFGTLSCSWYF